MVRFSKVIRSTRIKRNGTAYCHFSRTRLLNTSFDPLTFFLIFYRKIFSGVGDRTRVTPTFKRCLGPLGYSRSYDVELGTRLNGHLCTEKTFFITQMANSSVYYCVNTPLGSNQTKVRC